MAISSQSPEHSRELADRLGLRLDILYDSGNTVAGKFGLVFALPDELREIYLTFGIDLPAVNEEAGWTLPMPARYVVDGSSTIRYARVDPDYTRRPEPAETVRFLQTLQNDAGELEEQPDSPEQLERPEQPERPDSPEQLESAAQPEQSEQPEPSEPTR